MAKHRMKRRTGIVLIALIVVAVAGGLFHHKFGGGVQAHADRFVSRVDRELHLDRDQLAALHGLKAELLSLHRAWHESADARLDELVDLVTAQSMDQQALLAVIEKQTRHVNEAAPGVVAALARFADSLDAGQKSIVREKISQQRRWRHWRGHDS